MLHCDIEPCSLQISERHRGGPGLYRYGDVDIVPLHELEKHTSDFLCFFMQISLKLPILILQWMPPRKPPSHSVGISLARNRVQE